MSHPYNGAGGMYYYPPPLMYYNPPGMYPGPVGAGMGGYPSMYVNQQNYRYPPPAMNAYPTARDGEEGPSSSSGENEEKPAE